jgi:hypothetical protein
LEHSAVLAHDRKPLGESVRTRNVSFPFRFIPNVSPMEFTLREPFHCRFISFLSFEVIPSSANLASLRLAFFPG